MNLFLACFTSGACLLLSFLLFFHPLQQNVKANRWLGFFVFTMGCAFVASYLIISGTTLTNRFLFKCLNSLQFLLAPSLFISILYFVKPAKHFRAIDWLHFIPFIIYVCAEVMRHSGKESISTFSLFEITEDTSFLIRDILPFQTLFYLIRSYTALVKHKANLKLIASAINEVDLDWLVQFLFILSFTVLTWINDALFALPFLTAATPFVYAGAVFFLAYFAVKQKTIFAFKEKNIPEISAIIENEDHKPSLKIPAISPEITETLVSTENVSRTEETNKPIKYKRLSDEQIKNSGARLLLLMNNNKIYLDNELNLPTVAEKLGLSIHETSFLINQTAKDNFYNFINKYRVDEAKKLLTSSKMEELNILGIAFASGFNSKTAFNTAFKKWAGISPTGYAQKNRNK